MASQFNDTVSTRYHMYNSLFLNLPYTGIYRTGTLLPLLQQSCESEYQKGKDPKTIIKKFFREYTPQATREEQFDLLFGFIQYIERQVVLFDSIEDAAFAEINDLKGKGTVSELLLRVGAEGAVEALKRKLEDFSIRIVLTAHPTQFYPGNVLAILNDLEQAIRENRLEHINLLLRQLGKTPIINKEKPTPFDEAVSLSWFLENVFYPVIPEIINKLMTGLDMKLEEWVNYDLIKIGFWPGGDRDGNPSVTADTTLLVAQRLREGVLRGYYRDIRQLRRRLTFRSVEEYITIAEKKLYNTLYRPDEEEQYASCQELLNEMTGARRALDDDPDSNYLTEFKDELDRFILKIRVFGFYFSSLDIRQDSRKHGEVWASILQNWNEKFPWYNAA
ncbi:MAG TPA: phosphoenolpyruvate carboxylase, partial [Chryseolinea sp.]